MRDRGLNQQHVMHPHTDNKVTKRCRQIKQRHDHIIARKSDTAAEPQPCLLSVPDGDLACRVPKWDMETP